MASKLLSDLQAEIKKNSEDLAPIIEGLEDFHRLNISQESQDIVVSRLKSARERLEKMKIAADALAALDQHGYPEFEVAEVSQTIMDDLTNQQTTITAALGKFSPREEAATATIVSGTPVNQD